MKMHLACCITILISFLVSCYTEEIADNFVKTEHSNNWAVLVDTSRFWFNYRHVANVLSIYRSVKRLGIPDSQIILMIADDMACNPRNPRPATVFNNIKQHINVYGDDVEVDYRGYEVTVENFVRLLTGRLAQGTPRSKKLLTDEGSNILIYLTGHGGNGFLKFQDSEEITSQELGDALEQMWQKRRYHEILFVVDTCQASSMYEKFYSPNILAVASSLVGEDSLSHHVDPAIGVYIIDRYTYYALNFLEKVEPSSIKTLGEFLKVCPRDYCLSTVGVRRDLFRRDPDKVPILNNSRLTHSVMPIEHSPTRIGTQSSDTQSLIDLPIPEDMASNQQEQTLADVLVPSASIEAATYAKIPPFWKENPALWFAQALTQLIGSKKIHSTAYHPASNGMIERWHRTLKAAIICHNNQEWVDILPMVLLGLRTSIKENKRLRQNIRSIRPIPASHHRKDKSFFLQDLKDCTHVFVRVDSVRKPLEPPHEGPFQVLQRITDKVFEVDVNGKPTTISTERLKPAFFEATDPVDLSSGSVPSTSQSTPLRSYQGPKKVHFVA
ncbi:PREDICTED: putative GPI-anchor transamidase isoform X2 [Cyphomyrmex costatus]|uniref:putative GPI-anchor transamidase isoform X2 n=1 Tax=Cyphomyrmex costatus TaxID=456900 RepID=UPI0008522FFB|nr:PREDICTED: putative GPI-anchor transamidase isoform X2 [Cyphomyrmex costatus]